MILKNARWERFAQALANGFTAATAYTEAGYKPNRPGASRLQHRDNIKQRMAELMAEKQAIHDESVAEAVTATAITKEWILDMLAANVRDARAAGDYAPANAALALLGKATAPGMFAEHTNATVTTIDADLDGMTPAERRAEFDRLVAEAEDQGVVVALDGGADGGLGARRRA